MVDKLQPEHQDTYWKGVAPNRHHDSAEECTEAIERLLAARRPRTAFATCQLALEDVNAEVLFRLMEAGATCGDEPDGQYQLERYYVEKAFERIDTSPLLTLEQKAGLELAYIEVLAERWAKPERHGLPNLERYVEQHPELFARAIAWVYRRDDDKLDPVEWRVPSEHAGAAARRGYCLIDGLRRMPGYDDRGELSAERLAAWINAVRRMCVELGRSAIGDLAIGKMLAAAPMGDDDVWPCEQVREVMENMQSEDMMSGARTGLYNARGVVARGKGGGQERELAAKYRRWGQALQYTHPFVATRLLMEMAETYEREGTWHDDESRLEQRLR
jgi:hypothetical protein